jgi:hypothetical protein
MRRHTQDQTAVSIGRGKRSWAPITAISLIVLIVALLSRSRPVWAQAQAGVLTQHNDNSRTGANLNETILNTSNVNVNQFGKLFARVVDGQVYAQPLYVPGVNIQGLHNVVYVATMTNNLYAFDADDPAASEPLWQVNFGPSVPNLDVSGPNDIEGPIGITSTPVIDNASGTLYCVAKTKEGTSYVQRLHALDLTSGQEKLGGPVVIDGSVPGIGDDSVAGTIRFNALRHLNRPALLLSTGYLYIAFGSHEDNRPFHGWVLSYDTATLQQVASFNVTPSGWGGGIWSSGQGLALDDSGSIYFMTGNGTFNTIAGGQDCSSCFIKLSTPFLNLVDWFAPYNQNDLNVNDFDLNSSGPLLLPGFNRLVGGGKEGKLYVLDRANMGHFQAGSNSQIVQDLQITYGNHLHGSPIYWESPVHGPLVYVWYEENHLEAFKIVNGLFETNIDPNTGLLAPATKSTMAVPPGMPGGVLSLSANGTAAGSGILWATAPYNADAHINVVAGILRAFDASDLSIELWNSKQNAARDDFGNFAKFTPPTVANGKVYVATFSDQLLVYGLLGGPAPGPVVSSVAPGTGSTTGGTEVTITGSNFAAGATVTVGGSAATGVSVVNSTTITATTPAHAAGMVSVTVTNVDAQTGTLASGFTYTSASQPISLVQHTSTDAGITALSTLAFPASNTAHNWIAVVVRAGRTGQTFTITDTRGNMYRQAVQLNETVDLTTVAIFYAEDIAGGTNTVTVSDTIAGGTLRFAVFEYSGVATASSLDVTASAQGTSTTPNSGPATTTASGDLVIGGISTAESATFTDGSGYVIQEWVPAASTKLIVEDQRQTAAGTVSANATLSATGIWAAVMATFKRAP